MFRRSVPVDHAPADPVTACALAAAAGDRAALDEFVRATQAGVRQFLIHLAGPADADDLVQETYLRAVRSLPRFTGDGPARAWLLAIARRAAADAVRTAVRRPRTTNVGDWDAVTARGARVSAVDEAVLVGELVAGLEPDRRDAFVLTQVVGLGYAEAAQVCGCPVGTIRSRVSRAREDLVAALEPGDARASG
ncbi:sigma-70 family RNA polymerase sigma factor [Pseudonocardia sp. N23]|uniref:sigma-70 family RNA polymerase sigma factor n=1 Tax=Pseudonocardia sp. N23 TaxID=1987376 RepID=UPI000C02BBA1|nr:sigma-70 family RNA polymerase sigma factor [Pseudonocardia sp. N23]GAY09091.1 probable RNA polymerase sigma-C factor [Pseudonocardia sp. N23]